MSAAIFTRLHKLSALVDPGDLPSCENHYVIGADLLAAMPRADVQRSIAAMIEADMARLPFPELLVEFSVQAGVTRFLWLREAPGSIRATVAMLTGESLATVPTKAASVAIEAGGLRVIDHADERDGQAIALGAAFALLMLNVRGIDKQRIEPRKLNAARAKGGKTPIPTHVVLRIGVVYDRQGKPVAGGNRLKHVYLRAGHVRDQAYGPLWRDHRRIYIGPVLVNYRDGDDVPAPRPRVVKMGIPA